MFPILLITLIYKMFFTIPLNLCKGKSNRCLALGPRSANLTFLAVSYDCHSRLEALIGDYNCAPMYFVGFLILNAVQNAKRKTKLIRTNKQGDTAQCKNKTFFFLIFPRPRRWPRTGLDAVKSGEVTRDEYISLTSQLRDAVVLLKNCCQHGKVKKYTKCIALRFGH